MGNPSTTDFTEPQVELRPPTFGQVGYEAYGSFTQNKTFDGREMPRWHDLPFGVQQAWEASAVAIINNTADMNKKELKHG